MFLSMFILLNNHVVFGILVITIVLIELKTSGNLKIKEMLFFIASTKYFDFKYCCLISNVTRK